jgi:beta-galactosidase
MMTRRDVLASAVALSASSLPVRPSGARGPVPPGRAPFDSSTANPAIAPREQLLFDFGWKFRFGHGTDPSQDLGFGYGQDTFSKTGAFDFAKPGFDDADWRSLRLPHDWAVELPFVHDDSGMGDDSLRSHGYKPLGRRYPKTSVGWYRREFEIPAGDLGRRILVEFDGAFRDVLVFVNGCFIGRNDNGYVPFRFDLTDFLAYGAKNCIAVRVDASYGDGWFYEGAGIYRHVWLLKTSAVHLGRWESVVRSSVADDYATLDLSTMVENEAGRATEAAVKWTILDSLGRTAAAAESPGQWIPGHDCAEFHAAARLVRPEVWSVEAPNLYEAVVTIESQGKVLDGERVTFGVRTAAFDPDEGFLLNGRSLKIQGTCNHQDHAGVGSALPDRLQWYRLALLRDMGCTAVRTSHNMPTPEWVAACDRMGMMMMCETRQMSSNAEGLRQLECMIKRYRNSPSIILWSIGNEERLLEAGPMAEQGARIGATMVRLCHELDPTRVVSAAVDGSNEQGVSDALDIVGFNYNQDKIDTFHRRHPQRPLFGSETSSAVSTRGELFTDKARHTVGTVEAVWGTPEDWWRFYGERPWAAGGFAWTGFDYRGEPSPYGWPSVSSQFGILDTCGFPKDFFFYYRAWWRREPCLHVLPHWNWPGREGEEIPVWAYSNLDEVELWVNGKSLGRQKVPPRGHVAWKARYEPGAIEARGFKDGALVLIDARETTGEPESIRLTADRTQISADAEDIAILTVEALDRLGRIVPTASDTLAFRVSGNGVLIGVGNGDPNCQESDKEPRRSLFHGLAQVILQSTMEPGEIHVEALKDASEGPPLRPARLSITTRRVPPRPAVPAVSDSA